MSSASGIGCCPDKYLTNAHLTCLDITVLGKASRILAMSTTCPPGTDDETIQQCSANYTADRMFRLPPVTSLSTRLTYRNKLCAQCHNDTDIQIWSPSINCYNKTVDLNYLNSYDEIFTKADQNNCTIMYNDQTPNINKLNISCDSPGGYIGVCNTTGTWEQYDADIEMACRLDTENSGAYYRTHRNIFCRMCNPSEKKVEENLEIYGSASTSITQGNPILDACFQYDEIQLLHPYKNIFCYFLTTRNKITNPEFTFYEQVNLGIGDDIRYQAHLDILEMKQIPKFDSNSEIRNSVGEHLNSLVNNQSMKVDIEKLLHLHFLHYGLQERCSVKINISGTEDAFVQHCSCDIDCISSETCCADFALSKPISLLSVFGTPQLLIDRCYGHSSGNISKLCEGDGNENNVISSFDLPIINYTKIFKNIYCFACNEISFTYNDTTKFISNIGYYERYRFTCNFIPNINPTISSFISLIRFFNRVNSDRREDKVCKILALPSGMTFHLWHNHAELIQNCNVTGQWQTYDADIEWACRNYLRYITPFPIPTHPYYNIFCQICNMDERMIGSGSGITEESSCNITSGFDTLHPLMEALCYNQSSIITRFPVKNEFCRRCVSKYEPCKAGPSLWTSWSSSWSSSWRCLHDDFFVDELFIFEMSTLNVYRTLFTVTTHSNLNSNNLQHKCKASEVFDEHTVCI